MRLKAIAEACFWLPGFALDEDPIVMLGVVGENREAKIIPFPHVKEAKAQATVKAVWSRLEASVFAGLSGDVTKFEANVAAIELLRKLEHVNFRASHQAPPIKRCCLAPVCRLW